LFESVATALGQPIMQLQPDASAQWSFSLDFEGLCVDVVLGPANTSPAGLLLLTDLGPLPGSAENTRPPGAPPADAGQLARSLLDANFMMAGLHGPAFGRDPATGHILLHQSCRLSEIDGSGLQSLAAHLADMARWWRSDLFRLACTQLVPAPPSTASASLGAGTPGSFV
jgi:hypothetical protein